MANSPDPVTSPAVSETNRRPSLQDVLQSLGIVLEMEVDHLDGAIDLLDRAIQHNTPEAQNSSRFRPTQPR